jgi:chemotaxis protein methyltransferase CheR
MSRSDPVAGWPAVVADGSGHWGLRRRWPLIGEIVDLSVEYAARVYLAVARRIWRRVPAARRRSTPAMAYGAHVHALVLGFQPREQNHSTFFFRNRPELELLKRALAGFSEGSRLDLSVMGCSKGAEVYSFAWTIRSARPDLKLVLSAVDISQDILDFAQEGVYSLRTEDPSNPADPADAIQEQDVISRTQRDQRNVSIFDRVTESEMAAIFDVEGDQASVKTWLKEGILWRRGDVGSPAFARLLGPQDIVVANRFLCHMKPAAAERCLRSIAGVVKPGGYLFVSGVDLDVRTKVAREGGWQPVPDLIEDVYDGDPSLMSGWPMEYWSPEPFQAQRRDRHIRYASVFKLDNPKDNPK